MTTEDLKRGKPEVERAGESARTRAIAEGTLKNIDARDDAAVRDSSEMSDGCAPTTFRLSRDEIPDETVDGELCTADLLGQAGHGNISPAVRATHSRKPAEETLSGIGRQLKIRPAAETAQASCKDDAELIGEHGSRLCLLDGFVGHAEQCSVRACPPRRRHHPPRPSRIISAGSGVMERSWA